MGRKLTRKGLIKKNWILCREIVKKRAKGKCEKCKADGYEVDHCFSRNNKALFYEISNLTLLCTDCHSHKTYRRYGYDLAIYELVEEREGEKKFNEMRKIDENRGGFPSWQYISFHQGMYEKLTTKLNQEDCI